MIRMILPYKRPSKGIDESSAKKRFIYEDEPAIFFKV